MFISPFRPPLAASPRFGSRRSLGKFQEALAEAKAEEARARAAELKRQRQAFLEKQLFALEVNGQEFAFTGATVLAMVEEPVEYTTKLPLAGHSLYTSPYSADKNQKYKWHKVPSWSYCTADQLIETYGLDQKVVRMSYLPRQDWGGKVKNTRKRDLAVLNSSRRDIKRTIHHYLAKGLLRGRVLGLLQWNDQVEPVKPSPPPSLPEQFRQWAEERFGNGPDYRKMPPPKTPRPRYLSIVSLTPAGRENLKAMEREQMYTFKRAIGS